MPRKIMVTLLATSLLAIASPALALPGGSYLDSCINCRIEGTILHCWCKGSSEPSVLDMASCRSNDVANFAGKLTCMDQKGTNLPPGSYIQSCRECYVKDNRLHCLCRRAAGEWIKAAIGLRLCRRFENIDGWLNCEPPRP